MDSEDDNEDEYSPGKLNEEIASDGEDAPEPWIAPATVAPDRPSPVQRSSIAAWIRARPLRFSGYGHHTTGRAYETFSSRAQELLYRSYLNQLFADAGIPLEQAATESAIVLTVTPEFQFAENDKNMYGATTLNIELQLESPIGAGTEADATARVVAAEAPVSARTKLYGPMVLSQVSHEDAYLNSLRRINPRPMRRAIDTLRGELADAVAERGVPFSVAPVSDRSDEDVYAVLRSLGVPDKRERIWRLYDSPEAIRTEIAALLSGSLYRFFLNPLTREIRFLYNEES